MEHLKKIGTSVLHEHNAGQQIVPVVIRFQEDAYDTVSVPGFILGRKLPTAKAQAGYLSLEHLDEVASMDEVISIGSDIQGAPIWHQPVAEEESNK
jgi:hypothetical protein